MNIKNTLVFVIAFFSHSAFSAGPVGFGGIKIGMKKSEIEAISDAQPIYLKSSLVPYAYKNSQPKLGEEKFEANIQTPFDEEAFESTLVFSDGRLSGVYISIKDQGLIFEKLKSQIIEKYGNPKEENNRKEEQCIYQNGSNFKINYGLVKYVWTENNKHVGRVETSLTDILFDTCSSDYRGLKKVTRYLSISAVKGDEKIKAINAF